MTLSAPLPRIGYLVPQFPGQTHAFFWREIQAMAAMGADPVLLSTRPPPPGLIAHDWSQAAMARTEYLGTTDPRAALAGVWHLPKRQIAPILAGAPLALARDLVLALPAARGLVRFARETGISHVHAHSCGRAALIAGLAFHMGGPRYSLTLHGPLPVYGPGQGWKWRHAAFATVVASRLLPEVEAALPGDLPPVLEVQPMGVDTDLLARGTPWTPPEPGAPVRLFACGRLAPVKGHADLLLALHQLRGRGHDIRLTIAGEDDMGGRGYRATLEARIRDLGLSEVVQLLGAVDGGVIRQHLCAGHVFALASLDEGVPVALMESMSCALPTIGTRVGGVPDLVEDGVNGLLVPSQDPGAMAAAIERVILDPALGARLSKAGRATVVARFGAARGAETLLRLAAAAAQNSL